MIVGVVVTHAAEAGMLARCIRAVRAAGGVDHLVVVDNGGSAEAPDEPGVELLRVVNLGYGAAANTGFERAASLGADAYVLLNDDVFVRPGWIAPLADELVGPVGVVQPKLVYADREEPTINSLGVTIDRCGAGADIGDGEADDPSATADPVDIDIFTGGAAMLTREFIDATGGFDERFFLYYEDVDLAARGRRLGFRYRCVPESVVDHIGSVTTSARTDRSRCWLERNRLSRRVAVGTAPPMGAEAGAREGAGGRPGRRARQALGTPAPSLRRSGQRSSTVASVTGSASPSQVAVNIIEADGAPSGETLSPKLSGRPA
jgi:GT2 family glycosyltransferase